jgi:pantothenate kinase
VLGLNQKKMKNNPEILISKIEKAISNNDNESLQSLSEELELVEMSPEFIPILNQLLVNKNHKKHQFITRCIQDLKSPTSISFIQKALETNFDYLQYTCSEDIVIAKWFSHALAKIGTTEAINLMKFYTKSENEGIKTEMMYRLNKLKNSTGR